MKKSFLYRARGSLGAACLAVLLLAACSPAVTSAGKNSAQTAEPTMGMSMQTSASTPAGTLSAIPVTGPKVTISNFTFSPAVLNVPVGTTVTWVNQDDTAHTVTSVDKKFGSQGLDTGDMFSYKFATPGTYSYFCSIHPQMVGKIIVK